MVLAFLQAGLHSRRQVKYLLPPQIPAWQAVRIRGLILKSNLADEAENELRRQLLAYRGYRMNNALFRGFQTDAKWHRARLTIEELRSAKYARHETWLVLSEQTRLVGKGARNIGKMTLPGDDPTQDILDIAALREDGQAFPELIFLGEPNATADQLVLLEGHCRATAYICAADKSPPAAGDVDALVGFSTHIRDWLFF
jgi:hypothetical protein